MDTAQSAKKIEHLQVDSRQLDGLSSPSDSVYAAELRGQISRDLEGRTSIAFAERKLIYMLLIEGKLLASVNVCWWAGITRVR